ncbi:hypothetical protein [Chitinophaga sp. XS-30]|uniref:hypothetical protein n=1 Tax=Chitinophaga sp. XS-30 TaxID=2604421 RepID=UPI0011DDA76F|nr:hypothetical protein [Chitinophaga sp. XS-30]QEH43455.1 hypothetical protein FW415_22405 [Chitinophaga sp. XS-30]
MKRILMLFFLTGALSTAFAQEKKKVKPLEDLQLTEQQDKQVKEINRSYMTGMQDIRKDQALSREDRKSKLDALSTERTEKLKSVLDAEQFAKLQHNRTAAAERMKHGHKRGMHKKNGSDALKEIGLSETEGKELMSINKDFKSKAVALRSNSGMTKEQRTEEMKKLNDERLTKIRTTLGEEKYARYDEWKKKEREQIRAMRKHKADKKSIQ